MKFVLAPDSFKGTISAVECCKIIEKAIKTHFKNAKVISLPIADGGEGTCECFLSCQQGELIKKTVSGPYFEKIEGFYACFDKFSVIELAAAAALPMVENNKNPGLTTTFGVGELILDAIQIGANNIILAIGGSATNDCGAGLLSALGVKFYDKTNVEFVPTGETLHKIQCFDTSTLEENIKNVNFTVMCDVQNPLYGENGAAYIYAPQKGADAKMVQILDQNLKDFAALVKKEKGIDIASVPGGGAAGGVGAAAFGFLNAKLKSGIDLILDTLHFDQIISDADLIICGEGKLDGQSLSGKAVAGIARRGKAKNIPVCAIVGGIGESVEKIYSEGLSFVLSTNLLPLDFEKIRHKAKENLAFTADTLMRILKLNLKGKEHV